MSVTTSEIKQVALTAGISTASGTNTYTATIVEVKSLFMGLCITLKIVTGNTGACTLNLNSFPTGSIYKGVNTPVAPGDIPAGSMLSLVCDGTNWQITPTVILPNTPSMVLTNNSSGVPQAIYGIVDAINTTPEATLLALDWSSGLVTYTGTGGQKIFGTSYEFTCVATNTWRRSIYNMIYADIILSAVSDSSAVFTSAQMANLYPNAIPGNRARGNVGSYEYWGSIGWKYTAWTS